MSHLQLGDMLYDNSASLGIVGETRTPGENPRQHWEHM